MLTPEGPVWIVVRDWRTASRIGEHHARVNEWRDTRNADVLKAFERLSFRAGGKTYRFVTDSEMLNRLADADLLALERMYRAVQADSV